jgi:NADPH-dependent ferric siderophore reductase
MEAILLDSPIETPYAPPLRSRDVCDLAVVDLGAGKVSLYTPSGATSFAMTCDRSALPALRRAIAMLEGCK